MTDFDDAALGGQDERWLPAPPFDLAAAMDKSWQWHLVFHDGSPESCPVCTEAAYETALHGAAVARVIHGPSRG